MATKADEVRKKIIEMIYLAGAPHVGSALSCADIITAIYNNVDIERIKQQSMDRDRVILSKGHAIAAQLAALSAFDILEWQEVKERFCREGSVYLENTSPHIPYIETATGSLGQGISYGVGTALGARMAGYENGVYVIVGDGELNEGQCWEGIQQAVRLKLSNLQIYVDNNRLAGIGNTCIEGNLTKIFKGFGCKTYEVNGNAYLELCKLIQRFRNNTEGDKPIVVICNTIKGYGISFMENNNDWHYRPISQDAYNKALEELEGHAI